MTKRRTSKWTNEDDTLDEQFVFKVTLVLRNISCNDEDLIDQAVDILRDTLENNLNVDDIRSIEVQLLERKI